MRVKYQSQYQKKTDHIPIIISTQLYIFYIILLAITIFYVLFG